MGTRETVSRRRLLTLQQEANTRWLQYVAVRQDSWEMYFAGINLIEQDAVRVHYEGLDKLYDRVLEAELRGMKG